jgi:hypothetical protein
MDGFLATKLTSRRRLFAVTLLLTGTQDEHDGGIGSEDVGA